MKFIKIKLARHSLSDRGSAHFIAPLAVVLLVGVIGTYMLVASHAATAFPNTKCPKGQTLVNALPNDFIRGPLNVKAINNSGLVCVTHLTPYRQKVGGINGNTIVKYLACPSGYSYSYDRGNKNGTGAGGSDQNWAYKNSQGTTYYCIHNGELGKRGRYGGTNLGVGTINKGHIYYWQKAQIDTSKGCAYPGQLPSGMNAICNHRYAFFYLNDIVTIRDEKRLTRLHTAARVGEYMTKYFPACKPATVDRC